MFHYAATNSDLEKALAELEKIPITRQIQGALKFHLKGVIPDAELHLYSYENATSKYWVVVKPLLNFFHIYAASRGAVDGEEVEKFVAQILAAGHGIQSICSAKNGKAIGDPEIMHQVLEAFSKFGVQQENTRPVHLYVYKDAPEKPKTDILPPGFVYDEVREDDLDIILSVWQFGLEATKELIRHRAKYLPTVAIRTYSGKLAAFTMAREESSIIGVNVLPEYRGKRLRDALFAKISYDIYGKFQILPIWGTEMYNETMIRWAPKSHKSLNVDGQQALVVFSNLTIGDEAAEKLQKLSRE